MGAVRVDAGVETVRRKVGLAGWSVYSLRHYAITSWLRAGVPVHVVQRMAGISIWRRRRGMCII